ncbi:MAG TPA: M24 family metallopeptidase, partial [Candidatus Limnocylindrales bacterium]|nr:M24 family metallopeptidase [Candidatus Limnocylindrales bacterium]
MTAATSRPQIPPSRYEDRLAAAQALAAGRGIAGLLLGVGADLRYLTGYAAMPLERLTMLVLPAAGRPTLVAPRLEAMRAAASSAAAAGLVEVVAWDETDDAHAIAASILERSDAARGARARRGRVLVSAGLWAMHVLALQRALPERRFGLATEVLRDLRMAKDADEVVLLRLAAQAADRALAAVAAGRLVGRTEAEVSREIRDRLVAEGHDEASFAIVGSGPNSASPHHEPGERRIAAGEPVVLDIGGTLGGYGSDVT